MTPHQLAAIIRRAHAIGERKENQISIENYPREWQDMIVAALEAYTAVQWAPRHDHRVYFGCECCEQYAPENGVNCREDIGVMPDGTWLCDNCYSDCDKSAYGLVAKDVDDFEFPRFEDLPRPAAYTLSSTQKQDMIVEALEAFGAAKAPKVLSWARPLGATMDSMRKYVWETGLASLGDTILVWVNEGDFWQLTLNGCELKEYKNPEPMPGEPGPFVKADEIDRPSSLTSTNHLQEKPLSVCSRCGGKDPDCYICGTVTASTEGK
jgi:hypothetical protein